LFGSEEEEEAEKEEIPEDELCEECGEERAVWRVVGDSTQLCNRCQINREEHLVRISSSSGNETLET